MLRAHHLCFVAYTKVGSDDRKKAREHAERVVALAPDDPWGHVILGRKLGQAGSVVVLWGRSRFARWSLPDPGPALEHYARAIELAPESPVVYRERGNFYCTIGDYDRALADLNRALELRPDYHKALSDRAITLARLGEFDKALDDWARCIKFLHHDFQAHLGIAETHHEMGDGEAAVDAYTKAFDIYPSNCRMLKRRADALFRLGEYDRALSDLRHYFDAHPSETRTLCWIPPALVAACPNEAFKQGLLELAGKAVETSPNRRGALQARATLYLGLSQWDKAQADLEEALASGSAEHYTHFQHALLCLVLKQVPKYRDACATMVGKFGETDDSMAANFVAWTCALAPDAVDDYAPVIACATRAVDAQPESDQFLNTLGAILHRAGRHDEAIERLTELDRRREATDGAAKSSPAYTWYFLAMAHQKAGNAEQAREYLTKANQWTDKAAADEENPPAWNRRATLELLRGEAEALLGIDDSDSGTDSEPKREGKPNAKPNEKQE